MFQKILIANRGEIAVRIIRTCKQMGVETVAVYSTVDQNALHVHLADEAVCIGPPAAKYSYLNMENIISAALNTGAEAIHPGFGFLSENSDFAALCETCGIVFIGPKSETIQAMGDKTEAKQLMKEAGVPVILGSDGEITADEAKKLFASIGPPIMLKASKGGGGRGMRVVTEAAGLERAYNTAQQEARAAFGNGGLYLEKLLENPRHVEVQILADKYGKTVQLGERDCSIQRRNQKIIEETPAVLPEKMQKSIRDTAVTAAKSIGYENAGTVEFLVCGDNFYFMEMNTRIQVEHPVTEMTSGVDIVREQIRIAAGKHVIAAKDIQHRGHAIEVRINAEAPKFDFQPSPGHVELLHIPGGPGIRFDTMLYTDYDIPPHYDSMVGKLIAHGRDRMDALLRLRAALEELVIEGVPTNQAFLMMILSHEDFVKGKIDTGFVERHLRELLRYEA